MRPIGYVAAAAAGMIAPIAFALPAVAGTQAPALGGVSSIVGSTDGDDNKNDDNYKNDDNHSHDDFDRNFDHFDNGNFDPDDGDVDVDVIAAGSRAEGDVSLIVDIDDAGPFEDWVVNSSALEAGCESDDVTGAVAESDRFGHVDIAGSAENCIPGNYLIAVSQTGDAEETFYGEVTIR